MKKPSKPIGTVCPHNTLLLRMRVGEAEKDVPSGGTRHYEMFTSMTGVPIVQSKESGRFYFLDWAEILDLAIAAGVDEQKRNRKVENMLRTMRRKTLPRKRFLRSRFHNRRKRS